MERDNEQSLKKFVDLIVKWLAELIGEEKVVSLVAKNFSPKDVSIKGGEISLSPPGNGKKYQKLAIILIQKLGEDFGAEFAQKALFKAYAEIKKTEPRVSSEVLDLLVSAVLELESRVKV